MSKYIIEGNINFQEELYKLLDEPSDDENEVCQITSLHLKDNFVTLECKHHFNYEALYKEIYKQKYEFKTYDPNTLTKNDLQKFHNSKLDYFIKCPYCRNIQFTILPYYKELGLKEIYGINSLDKTLPNSITINNSKTYYSNQTIDQKNYTYHCFGVLFKWGDCCETINKFGDKCTMAKYITTIPNTELSYCRYHYRRGLMNYKMAEKKKILDAKILAKKEKEDILNKKKKELEEMNIERETKGLAPLKRLHVVKKKVENIVEQGQAIQQYVPEEDSGCNAILKSGPNKGNKCGCKKVENNGLCKRHCPKDQQNDNISKNIL